MSAAAVWLNAFFAGFDYTVFNFFHSLLESAGTVLTPFFRGLTFLGELGWAMIVLAIGLMLFRKTRRAGLAIALALILSGLLTDVILKNLIGRPRPFVDQSSLYYQWYLQAGSQYAQNYSFPSGHTSTAMAAMLVVFMSFKHRHSWPAFIYVLLMGASRVYFLVHYPSDILGGLVVGAIAGLGGLYIAKLLQKYGDSHPGSWLVKSGFASSREAV